MNKPTDIEEIQEAMVAAYADLWAHYHSLIRAIGMSGIINDGRLAVDAQIVMEREGSKFAQEGRDRFKALLAIKG